MKLGVHDFAQIELAEIDFGEPGDLTVLVGQQATGKSLILQWLKLLTDSLVIRRDWVSFGSNWKIQGDPLRPLDLFFGEGLGKGWRSETLIELDGRPVELKSLFNLPSGHQASKKAGAEPVEKTYFIPAHRALLLTDGWPRNFQQHVPGTPYVARAQSERLARWLSDAGASLFPVSNKLQKEVRDLFNAAIFHNATLNVDRSSPQSRLVLTAQQDHPIPYMAWTAGQREFVPLLIALYELIPGGATSRLQGVETVVMEEPELGLHPAALFAVGVALLHLLARGYRVVVSTHSPLMVDFAWTLNRLRVASAKGKADIKDYCQAFDLHSNNSNKELVRKLQNCRARAFYLSYAKSAAAGAVKSKDISSLLTYAGDDDQSSWGELLKYSIRLAEVIGQLEIDFSSLKPEELVQ